MNPGDTPGTAQPSRRILRDGHSLLHEEGACLPLRSRHGRCQACAQACPASALTVSVVGVLLGEACTGCGRCTAVCPTEALTLPELLALPEPPPAPTAATPPAMQPLRLECRMVPEQLLAPGSWVLPCTGAASPGRLMAQAAAGVTVDVVDRGWCDGCPAAGTARGRAGTDGTDDPHSADADHATEQSAGSAAHPASAAIAVAVTWLDASGSTTPIHLRREPLPLHLRPDTLPAAPAPAAPLDRRRFFRAALDKPAGRDKSATPMGGDGRAAYPADRRQPSPERARQHQALQRLAQAGAADVPAEFFPSLHADARCCDQRLCVALCPTAALTVADDGGTAQLRFDPVRCIACGTCERACPEGALALTPHGGVPERQTLATHQRVRCAECGDAYTVSAAGRISGQTGDRADTEAATAAPALRPVCPQCVKSHRFMSDARRQLFGALT